MANKSVLIALALFASTSASAWAAGGNELGNGGDVFVCQTPGGIRAEMVDVVEARMNGRTLDFGPAGLNHVEKVRYVLNKWAKVSPLRTERYLKWLDSFESESRILPGTLPNLSDEGIVVIPPGCQIQQVAIQLSDADLGGAYKRYTINQDYWNLMDEDNRAAMILHELIFREAIQADSRVSMRVRYLNGVLLSQISVNEYFESSARLGGLFIEWGWAGFEVPAGRWKDWGRARITDEEVDLSSGYDSEIEAVQFWIKSEVAEGRDAQTEYGCLISARILRNNGNRLFSDTSNCRFSGAIRLSADEAMPGLMGKYELKLEKQSGLLWIEGKEIQAQGFGRVFTRVSQMSATQVRLKSYFYENKVDRYVGVEWDCVGISAVIVDYESRMAGFESESGSGTCTLRLSRGYDKRTWKWAGFHRFTMKFGIAGYEWDHLEVVENDGQPLVSFMLGETRASCLKEQGDSFQCTGIPAQLKCQVPILNGSGVATGWSAAEAIQIQDTTHLRAKEGQPGVQLLVPQGQTVAYRKAGWGSAKPERLTTDAWLKLSWDPSGNCKLER